MRIETGLKEDFRVNREENAAIAKDNREELNNTLKNIVEQSRQTLKEINQTLDDKISSFNNKMDENNKANRSELTKNMVDFSAANITQLDKINSQLKDDSRLNREAISNSFKDFQTTLDQNIKSFNDLQREKFSQLEIKQSELIKGTETKLESIRTTVEEKLEKTLSERLGQSFETVGKQLIEVQKGLGEMQTLAQDVGGLKKVLSNVKMRGGFGEVQLHMLLENILAPDQYEGNVATKKDSNERVEFAVKFPNKEGDRDYVWLPIDAKFPKDAYEHLQNAYDTSDAQQIESAQKNLDNVIKKMAKDISDKYIDAPGTTNFGIMFLPFEGLYAEVVRKASLLEQIQRECNVIVTGPTTLAVILNSLQMGFRTLAIQKRSSEVWKILSAVKKEFGQFGGMLDKAQKNIQTGLHQLDDVVGVRTRAIQRQLRGVESLEAENVLKIDEDLKEID
ncbi:MAG: DNA recombination protein RmuC [Bacteroidetes bacterium]|nr:DNA recombination protein RmuC [Bacteroidota bacterium]